MITYLEFMSLSLFNQFALVVAGFAVMFLIANCLKDIFNQSYFKKGYYPNIFNKTSDIPIPPPPKTEIVCEDSFCIYNQYYRCMRETIRINIDDPDGVHSCTNVEKIKEV